MRIPCRQFLGWVARRPNEMLIRNGEGYRVVFRNLSLAKLCGKVYRLYRVTYDNC